jgi:hypothetical protein
MNPDVERLMTLATEWDDQAPDFEAPPPIAGAAANAASLLSKQILESERRIKSVPRRERGNARDEILLATVSGYGVVRFLFRIGDPRLTGARTPAATQPNMARIMSKGAGYSDKEMTQVLLVPRVMAHAVDHARISQESGAVWNAFGGDAKSLKMFGYVTGMRIGLAEHIEFGPFAMFGPEPIS